MRVALGTAQWSGGYGVVPSSVPTPREVSELLETARELGIDTIDTAAVYGDAESLLGGSSLAGFRVVTKLPKTPRRVSPVTLREWISNEVRRSIARLRLECVDTILLHDAEDLRIDASSEIVETLWRLRESGVVRRVGVSCYDPTDAELAKRHGLGEVLQVPLNVLDRRFQQECALSSEAGSAAEWHARSVYLQGLLLASPSEARTRLGRAHPALQGWHRWCTEQGVAPGHAALAWVMNQIGPRRVVVGVNGVDQLRQVARWAAEPAVCPPDMATLDGALIDPRRWP
jgi:aryl-alcohol dehydrogenase-like predicted oxidoreductase